jgi:nicotinate-nucleotide pyrophosphorylase
LVIIENNLFILHADSSVVKLKDYLNEDLSGGDVTSDALLGDETAVGAIIARTRFWGTRPLSAP